MYQARHMLKVLRINRNTYNNWVGCRGIINASIPAEGSGTRAEFTFDDILRARVAQMLRNSRVDLRTAYHIATEILNNGGAHTNTEGVRFEIDIQTVTEYITQKLRN